ncbi:MAG: hypothetical protein SangKO_040870 [Sandaracinaceae bacterium]
MGALAIEELSQEIRAELLGGLPRVPDHGALACPARLWLEMPRPAVLRLHVPGVPGVVSIDGTDGLVFDADEWAALVEGVAADRVWPTDFRGFCARKAAEPAWRLELDEALAGAQPDRERALSVCELLERVGAQLLSID